MHYIGVDIIEISRIKKATSHWGDSFLHRVYTKAELKLCRNKPSSLAARFAGKEAAVKALQKTRGISWQHIEIIAEPDGRPRLRLYGKAQEQAQNLGLNSLSISLSHSREYAIAFVTGDAK